ncbi:ras and Rab interactor 2-like [Thalassophryne amazonica]|uniref:ras and Rab interactor 2-like n=1 Tax=Thalassophryne amazonica TaxID=390379 RepID=UPI0014712C0D|nr:ras and Rab interactor 2-like [Thalassophryne amazonica]
MAHQEEPLYDFPEPTQPSENRFLGHQRGHGSLKSISILDRLLLTVPVWFQLSVNAATALHILQREPPGTFLVRKSRTSQRNVLCVRLVDNSVPCFVQQFCIREENSTLCLETSVISFPDLPRLISFYCVSRDVLPFPLELPEAIARATSQKELESISHMGIEFWSSHLNVRGPREMPKAQKDSKWENPVALASLSPAPTTTSAMPPDLLSQSKPDDQLTTTLQSDSVGEELKSSPTLLDEFCPIRTRSPRELDCGSGLGALCFINPLFLHSQNPLSRRQLFKRSVKIRVSTEPPTLLSPPLEPPPPPPLMPKTKSRCKAKKHVQPSQGPEQIHSQNSADTSQSTPTYTGAQDKLTHSGTGTQDAHSQDQVPLPSQNFDFHSEVQEPMHQGADGGHAWLPTATVIEPLTDDLDYMQPSSMIAFPHSPMHLLPSVCLAAPLSHSPGASPSLSLYQSPSPVPFFLSPYDSPSTSPAISPYQSPSPSPKAAFSLPPLPSPSFSQVSEEAYHTPATPSRLKQQIKEGDVEEVAEDVRKEIEEEQNNEGEESLCLEIVAASLNDTSECSSSSSLEEAARIPPASPLLQDNVQGHEQKVYTN